MEVQNKLGSNNLVLNKLEDKQLEEKTNTGCLVKEQEKVHLGIKVGAHIMVTGVPSQEGAEGNVAKKNKVKESMKANLRKLLKYNAWSTRILGVYVETQGGGGSCYGVHCFMLSLPGLGVFVSLVLFFRT
ncbi:hypothetical protein Tco_0958611 [Tanacetum coccineum]